MFDVLSAATKVADTTCMIGGMLQIPEPRLAKQFERYVNTVKENDERSRLRNSGSSAEVR